MRVYDLRHHRASVLIKSGVNIVEAARQLGHSPTVLLDVYAHIIEATEHDGDVQAEIVSCRKQHACDGALPRLAQGGVVEPVERSYEQLELFVVPQQRKSYRRKAVDRSADTSTPLTALSRSTNSCLTASSLNGGFVLKRANWNSTFHTSTARSRRTSSGRGRGSNQPYRLARIIARASHACFR
jgi:hypothetical protein